MSGSVVSMMTRKILLVHKEIRIHLPPTCNQHSGVETLN
jgi:hypothetical protein